MEEMVEVSLTGGPEAIPRAVRVERRKVRDGRLKIEHRGGYEHFECADGECPMKEDLLPIFHWKFRTKIAE